MRWRTNWCEKARDTPLMPNSKCTCSKGETCPVFRRSCTKAVIFSCEMRSSAMRASTWSGVRAE